MLGRILGLIGAFLVGGAILVMSYTDANSTSVGSIEIKKRQRTEKSTAYSADYSGCRFVVSIDLFSIPNLPEHQGLRLIVTDPCREPLPVQMEVFGRMLEYVVADRPDARKSHWGVLPGLTFSEEFMVNIVRKAYASKQWKKSIAGKKKGDSVNKETLNLLRESSAYGEFVRLLAQHGIPIEISHVEEAFLATVSDIASLYAKHQDLSDLPKKFLAPDRAIVGFKVVGDGK